MKEHEARIACAELQGFKRQNPESSLQAATWYYKDEGTQYVGIESLPNFPQDLNAMHEIEETLGNGELEQYEKLLKKELQKEELLWLSGRKRMIISAERFTFHATAKQKLTSYLKIKGKWVD